MNRKDAKGAGRVIFGAHNPLLRSIHTIDSPASGIEFLDAPITAEDSPEVAQEKFKKLYANARDLVKWKAATTAELAKLVPQIELYKKVSEKTEETRLMAVQALELARASAGTVPGDGKLGGRSAEFVRTLSRGPKPDREFCELARVQSIDTDYFHLVSNTGRAIKSMGAPEEVDALLARFRLLNDVLFMLNKYFSIRDSGTYLQMGGMQSLAVWKEWEEVCKRVRFAATDLGEASAATGGAWVPTIWSGNLINLMQIMARCANYFEVLPMQSNLQKGFVEGVDTEAFFIAEGASITQDTFTTFDATWTAKKLAARIHTSRELQQDAAIPMVQEIERKLAKSLTRGWEKVIVNGQATGSIAGGPGSASLDTGETIVTNDARLLANGVRYWHAQTGLGVVDASAGLTIEAMAKLRGPMGAYGTDPSQMIWLCSAWGAAHILTVKNGMGQPIVLGPAGFSPPPGTVGRMLDSDIVLSSYVSDAMNSSGVIDGAGVTTAIYYINTDQFKVGERLGILVEGSVHELFSSDRIVFKAVRRVDFQPVRTPSASEPMVNAIGNLPLA